MQIHNITIQNSKTSPCLDYIKDGIKTVEGRKYSPKYAAIKENDVIVFQDTKDPNYVVYAVVTYVNKYKTLEEYLSAETFQKTLPWIKTMAEAIQTYNQWSSPAEREQLVQQHGYSFLGIGVKVITDEEFRKLKHGGGYKEKYYKYKHKYLQLKDSFD